MPVVQCVECSQQITLDEQTYYSYKGNIRCPNCKALLEIETSYGFLKGTPIIREKGKRRDLSPA